MLDFNIVLISLVSSYIFLFHPIVGATLQPDSISHPLRCIRGMSVAPISNHNANNGGDMYQSCAQYRGYAIEVQVKAGNALSITGVQRRYSVSWRIYSAGDAVAPVAKFPERVSFLSGEDAARYAENRAHVFIDSLKTC